MPHHDRQNVHTMCLAYNLFTTVPNKLYFCITGSNHTVYQKGLVRANALCLEGKGENYQVCSVQYCVQQLCTVRCTHIWTD